MRSLAPEDTLFGTMTVYETFAFVAALTREEGVTLEDEKKRIMDVIAVR
jgi:hypothetical protein